MLSWNRENTLKGKIPNRAGIYKFYDKNRRLLYVGHSKALRHRVQSYRQDDDFKEHPTKPHLRNRIEYYQYIPMPVNSAREVEKRIKPYAKYNYL